MSIAATDVIEKTIGTFGKYQTQILCLLLLASLQANYQLYNLLFILPKANYICLDDNANNGTNHCPCENPQHDQSEVLSSVTSEWNLICDRTTLASWAQSMVQFGYLPGSLICGTLSDRYGRKPIAYLALVLLSISVLLSAVAPNIWTLLAARFVSGLSTGGVVTITYVFLVELTGPSFRTMSNIYPLTGNIFCYFTISLIAYYVRKWRYIQIITAVPGILSVGLFWIVPESPRWLITVGRTEEAIQLLIKIAKRNGLPTDNIESIVNETIDQSKSKSDQEKRGSLIDLFKTSKMRLYSISVAMIWFICGHTYYGINQYVGRLQGNLYFNTMLSALCLTPSIIMFVVFTKYCKRRVGLIVCFLMASISLLVFILTPNTSQYLHLPFLILGLLGSYTAYVQMYLYSTEIFPTIVRNSALGFASMASRIGSFLAPFDVNIGIEWLTITIFMVMPLIAILFCFILPETKDMVLKNTIEQTEKVTVEKATYDEKTSKE